MYALQHGCMLLKIDVLLTKLIQVIFQFVSLRITIIYFKKTFIGVIKHFNHIHIWQKFRYSPETEGGKSMNHKRGTTS